MAKLSRQETETIIRRCDDGTGWDVYSAIPRDMRRIRAMAKAFSCEVRVMMAGYVASFHCPPLRCEKARAGLGTWKHSERRGENPNATIYVPEMQMLR